MNTAKKKKLILIVLIFGIAVDFMAGLYMWGINKDETAAQFKADSEIYFFAVEKELASHLQILKSITSFYNSTL